LQAGGKVWRLADHAALLRVARVFSLKPRTVMSSMRSLVRGRSSHFAMVSAQIRRKRSFQRVNLFGSQAADCIRASGHKAAQHRPDT
jgi:hypothetical protein